MTDRTSLTIGVPDLVSNSYFPAVAAVELGFFREEGFDASVELIFPVAKTYQTLAEGKIDFVAGSAHSALAVFPEWRGVKLLCAQAQGMYWFLVMRTDIGATRGDLSCVKGRSIGAAPWVDMGLRYLLAEMGLDCEHDGIRIGPVPGAVGAGTNFGLTAAKALETGKIDGFWANGMAAELAVRGGFGTVVHDMRRDGPISAFHCTMATIAASSRLIEQRPEAVRAAVRALTRAQTALREDVTLATAIGRKLFPQNEAELIADLIRRDLPYYDPSISKEFIDGMNRFTRWLDLVPRDVPYGDIVATDFCPPPGSALP